tara:strand:- start:2967 stop:3536 length:570 start_codon:yes stop_codon:yes gene_type:complete
MNYPKLGKYQAGGGRLRKNRARRLQNRFRYLDKELKRDAVKATAITPERAGKTGGAMPVYYQDTEYNRKIKAGMARVERKRRINRDASELAKARKRRRVNRQFDSMKDELRQDVKTAKKNLRTSRKEKFGKRKARREMVKTGKGAEMLGTPKGVLAGKRISSNDEYQNYGKMRGGRTGFRGKARTKRVR